MPTLFDKIWDAHVVDRLEDGTAILYIDRHLVHEVTSPQAFEGLRLSGRRVRRPDATIAVVDHNVPTTSRLLPIEEPESRLQIETLERNVAEFGVPYFPLTSKNQGIVHIVGPEQGLSLPGMTIVCGDSHTSTHGALGALAFGIGTSEVEHVLATQTVLQKPAKNMKILVEGMLPARRHRQGRDARHHRPDRHRRRHRACHRIRRLEAIRALDMAGPHDGLQHVDRRRRARRPHRPRRNHLQLHGRAAPSRRKGEDFDQCRRLLEARCPPTRGRSTTPSSALDGSKRSRRWSPGARARRPCCRSPAPSPTPPMRAG